MKLALSWFVNSAVMALVTAGCQLLWDYSVGNALRPASGYLASGGMFGAAWWLQGFLRGAGWLRGVWRDPREVEAERSKLEQLAEDRERLIAEFESRKVNESQMH